MIKIQIERINISSEIGFTVYTFGKGSPCVMIISGETRSDGCGIATAYGVMKNIKSKSIQGTIKIIPQFNEHPHIFKIFKCLKKNLATIDSPICKLIDRLQEVAQDQCTIIEVVCKKDFLPHIVIPYKYINDETIQKIIKLIPIEIVTSYKLNTLGFKLIEKEYKVITIVGRGSNVFELNDVNYLNEVLIDTLSELGFVKKKKKEVKSINQRIFKNYTTIECPSKGIFIPSITLGDEVVKGATIGTINDVEIKSSYNGVVIYISKPRICSENEVICAIVSQDNL